jgi:hypothetical protein
MICCRGRSEGDRDGDREIGMGHREVWRLALRRGCDILRISTWILARVNIHLDSQQRLI